MNTTNKKLLGIEIIINLKLVLLKFSKMTSIDLKSAVSFLVHILKNLKISMTTDTFLSSFLN
jgi:hypothetical protein